MGAYYTSISQLILRLYLLDSLDQLPLQSLIRLPKDPQRCNSSILIVENCHHWDIRGHTKVTVNIDGVLMQILVRGTIDDRVHTAPCGDACESITHPNARDNHRWLSPCIQLLDHLYDLLRHFVCGSDDDLRTDAILSEDIGDFLREIGIDLGSEEKGDGGGEHGGSVNEKRRMKNRKRLR